MGGFENDLMKPISKREKEKKQNLDNFFFFAKTQRAGDASSLLQKVTLACGELLFGISSSKLRMQAGQTPFLSQPPGDWPGLRT